MVSIRRRHAFIVHCTDHLPLAHRSFYRVCRTSLSDQLLELKTVPVFSETTVRIRFMISQPRPCLKGAGAWTCISFRDEVCGIVFLCRSLAKAKFGTPRPHTQTSSCTSRIVRKTLTRASSVPTEATESPYPIQMLCRNGCVGFCMADRQIGPSSVLLIVGGLS